LSDIITDFFIKNGSVTEDERPIYKYGAEVLISTITGIVSILLLGVIFGYFLDSVIFLLGFITIRIFTGGYHATTYIKCNLTFILCFTAVILLNRFLPERFEFSISVILLIIALTVIIIWSPIENKHKPLYGNEKTRYKKISIIMSFIWSGISVGLYFAGMNISKFISITLFSIAVLMAVEKIKQKFQKHSEEAN